MILQPGPEGEDLWITNVYNYNDNFGVDNELLRVGGWADSYYSLLQFDLTSDSLPASVTSATLRLYNAATGGTTTSMDLYQVNTAWEETYGWYDYPLSVSLISFIAQPANFAWLEIDLTAQVNQWLANPESNHGIQLRPRSTANNWNEFVSSDAIGDLAGFRPQLVLEFSRDLDAVPGDTSTPFTLGIGQTRVGTIDQNDLSGDFIDRDYYRVTLTGGEQYTFSANADISTTDTLDEVFIRLRDASGNILGSDTYAEGSAASFAFDVPGTGAQTYYLAVSAGGDGAWWDNTGSYTVSLTHSGVAEPVNYTPTAQGHSRTAEAGTEIPLTNLLSNSDFLFSYSDLNGLSDIVSFAVQDRTPGGGYLTFNGQQMASNQVYERPIDQIDQWAFVVGASGSDQIGFNAIDQADDFNSTAVATVTAQPAPEDPPRSAEDLFGDAKLTALAEFALAAYADRPNLLNELDGNGWSFLNFDGKPYYSYFDPDEPTKGVAQAIVAESEDSDSLVIAFAGTATHGWEKLADWVSNVVGSFGGLSAHYSLFQPLLAALNLSSEEAAYSNIYVTGHSLGAAMAQAFKMAHPELNVEAVGFANPGYNWFASPSSPLDNMINITIQSDPIALARSHPLLSVRGDDHLIAHHWLTDDNRQLHSMELYLQVAKHLDETGQTNNIFKSSTDSVERDSEIQTTLENYGGKWYVGKPEGAFTSADFSLTGTSSSRGPSEIWSTSVSEHANSTPASPYSVLSFHSAAYLDAEIEVSADGEHLVVSDGLGAEYLAALGFKALSLVAGGPAPFVVKLGALAGTHILNKTVYFTGGAGDDVLDGIEADKRIVADGGGGDDVLTSGSSNDLLAGGPGNDALNGGAGIDTALLNVLSTAATWERSGGGWTVTSADGIDTIINIERLQFLDLAVSLAAPASDLTGDGASDILWLEMSSQFLGFYGMDGSTVAGWGSIGIGAAGWTLVGKGDFTGDGTTDLLWQSDTGDVGLYEMSGGTVASWISVNSGTSGWSVVGTGDYNGDATNDVLWQNDGSFFVGLYEMDGGVATWANIGTAPGWTIIGSGDFTGDGTDDILWQEDSSGFVGFYEMSDSAVAAWGSIGVGAAGWNMVGIGHFNGDGTDDILWQSDTGDVGFYQMDGGAVAAWVGVNSGTSGWSVAAIGDYNGDGTDDILWQEDASDFVGLYEMHDGVATWVNIGSSAPGWEIV